MLHINTEFIVGALRRRLRAWRWAMAAPAVHREPVAHGWRPRPFALLLIAAADFCAAVGVGDLFLGQPAAGWLLAAAVLLLAGVSASD